MKKITKLGESINETLKGRISVLVTSKFKAISIHGVATKDFERIARDFNETIRITDDNSTRWITIHDKRPEISIFEV